jgi:hypothetical protein
VAQLVAIFEASELECEEVSLEDFGVHPHQLLLLNLVGCDWSAAELDPSFRIGESRPESRHGRAQCAPRNAVARLVEALKCVLETGAFRQHGVEWDSTVFEDQL